VNTALKSGFEPGGDKFRGVSPDIYWEIQLEHAERIGLGNRGHLSFTPEAYFSPLGFV